MDDYRTRNLVLLRREGFFRGRNVQDLQAM